MSKERRNILWGLLVILLLISVLVFFVFKNFTFKSEDPVKSIPDDASVIIKVKNLSQLNEVMIEKADFWNDLKQLEELQNFNQLFKDLDSLSQLDRDLEILWNNHPVYYTILTSDTNGLEGLLISSYVELNGSHRVVKLINNLGIFSSNDEVLPYRKVNIKKIEHQQSKTDLFYACHNGVFWMSQDVSVIQKAIDQLMEGVEITMDKYYSKLSLTEGKYAEVNIYFNFNSMTSIFDHFMDEDNTDVAKILSSMGAWSELDMKVKSHEVLFNGFTNFSFSNYQFLKTLQQEPQSITIPQILPYNTNFLLDFGLENYAIFYDSLANYNNEIFNIDQTKINQDLNKKYDINIEKDLISWIGSEFALASSVSGKGYDPDYYIVAKVQNQESAIRGLNRISNNISRRTGDHFVEEYQEYIIKRINDKHFIENVFGTLFSDIESPYFVLFKDYVIFSNTVGSLKNLISTFYTSKTLSENSNYQFFSDNIFESSNIYFYCNIRKSVPLITSWLNEDLGNIINKNKDVIKNFEGFGMQFSYSNEMFFTNLYLKYNPAYREENLNNWEVDLDASIIGHPYLIKNHTDKRLNVIAFDAINNMYLIDHIGQIKWKIPVLEPPVSEISLIDYYKNNKWQYFFNTENYLYLVDLHGNLVSGFPIKLDVAATNAVAVFDYEKKRDYRLLLALEDQKIYSYKKDGSKVEGWFKYKTENIVEKKVQHFLIRGKDYLIFSDKLGKISITNRRGEIRIPVQDQFVHAKNASFYINLTNTSKGLFLTTNNNGKLTYISSQGKVKISDFGTYSEDHYFLYEDFDGDDDRDFIYLDKNSLKIFNRYKDVLLEHEFEQNITIAPQVFRDHSNIPYLSVVQDSIAKVSVFSVGGLYNITNSIYGTTQCVTGELNTDEKTNLIIGSGNKIYNYLFE